MVKKVRLYFREELEQDIGAFDAAFLIDFFSEEMSAFFYNRGLYDAEIAINEKDVLDCSRRSRLIKPHRRKRRNPNVVQSFSGR